MAQDADLIPNAKSCAARGEHSVSAGQFKGMREISAMRHATLLLSLRSYTANRVFSRYTLRRVQSENVPAPCT